MRRPYPGCDVMIGVKECHDLGCRCVYLVGCGCITGDEGFGGLCGVLSEVCCCVVPQPILVY